MGSILKNTSAFNQDNGSWNTLSLINMYSIFQKMLSFNQDLSGWCITNISAEPSEFSINSPLKDQNKPLWWGCP